MSEVKINPDRYLAYATMAITAKETIKEGAKKELLAALSKLERKMLST